MLDAIQPKQKKAAVGILCQTDPSHAELLKTLMSEAPVIVPENVSKLMNAEFARARDGPMVMHL